MASAFYKQNCRNLSSLLEKVISHSPPFPIQVAIIPYVISEVMLSYLIGENKLGHCSGKDVTLEMEKTAPSPRHGIAQ